MLNALVRRATVGEVEALEELQALALDLPAYYSAAIHGAHTGPAGYSYGDIAKWLNVSRQAARQMARPMGAARGS